MKIFVKFCLVLVFSLSIVFVNAQTAAIRINQLGYYPNANKVAVVSFAKGSTFELVDTTNDAIVYSGDISDEVYWTDAGDSVSICDFTSFTSEGIYKVRIPDFGESYPFTISPTVLREAAYASLKSFYYSRCSFQLDSAHAGLYARKGGHYDTAVVYHASTGKTGELKSPGGWYDAGDFGKYVVNAGITLGNLLSYYENFNGFFADSIMNIPESGNGKSDLLDEVKFELDWLKTMQDDDGGVFNKLSTLNFVGYILPENATETRYVIGKSTSAALDFAAVMAMAGRIYKDYDSVYAKDCKTRAEEAWVWAKENPQIYFSNPSDVSTGQYGDQNVTDEFAWAASELYITTQKDEYKTYVEENLNKVKYNEVPNWYTVGPLGALSLATQDHGLSGTITDEIKESIVSMSDDWLDQIESSPNRVPYNLYNWGSNSGVSNSGIALIYAYLITGEEKYVLAAAEVLDYIFGKNATGFSFMTSYGYNTPMEIHHRVTLADGIEQPVPGYVAGGPNKGRQDNLQYPFTNPAKSYFDDSHSYASNEVAINWGAPLTALIASVDALLGDSSNIGFELKTSLNNPPNINLRQPIYNAEYDEGEELVIDTRISDDDGISKVELYIDSRFVETLTEKPFTWSFDALSVGTHTVTIVAFDSTGLASTKSQRFKYVAEGPLSNQLQDENELLLRVVPNPVVDNFSIQYEQDNLSPVEFILFDMNGRVIDHITDGGSDSGLKSISWKLNANLGAGMYYISMIQNGQEVAHTKLIKVQ